jgi:hypothetical protein
VEIGELKIGEPKQFNLSGRDVQYHELLADATLTPPAGASPRVFNLGYDAVVHKQVNHTVLVSIRQDWSTGVIAQSRPATVGVIKADPETGNVSPLVVDVSKGSLLSGFVAMVKLGMRHIQTGTDHLLFLLTLLLPAPLLLWHIFGITTAFTIGHSLTLIIATLARLHISSQPVEALIAVSIIVSAVHALRPIFPGREVWVAGGFGLIHGTAFSFTLAELNLNRSQTAVSLLGFNLGIELMQIVIIALVIPALIVFAQTQAYPAIRITGAVMALVAAIGWLGARLGFINPIGTLADSLSAYAGWVVAVLIVAAAITWAGKFLAGRRAAVAEA